MRIGDHVEYIDKHGKVHQGVVVDRWEEACCTLLEIAAYPGECGVIKPEDACWRA